MPYAIDLFCGAGGMSEGLIQAGFHILFSSDINEQVELTYKNRHEQLGLIQGYNTHFERTDINDLTGNFIMNSINNLEMFRNNNDDISIDAIFGGPPCQGFSLAGRRQMDDPRNLLFKEYLRVVSEIMPKYVVMENVEGFLTAKMENFIGVNNHRYEGLQRITDILLNEFHEIGYETLTPTLLDASDYGVPQRRNRAIFIAYLNNCPIPNYPRPLLSHDDRITVLDAVGDLIYDNRKRKRYNPSLTKYQLESREGRTLKINHTSLPYVSDVSNYEFANHQDYIVERFSLYNRGEDTEALRRRIKTRGISIRRKPNLIKLLTKDEKYTAQQIIDIFRKGKATDEMIEIILTKKNNRTRMRADIPSPTILTLPDDYISPFENRIFTVREMARLQSFDDSFIFLGKRTTGGDRRRIEVPQYSQVGNAVPPLLSKVIAEQIISLL